jgi:hypothetical protein
VRTSTAVGFDVLPPNVSPTALMTSPSAGSTFAVGAAVPLAATADDKDGTIAKVEFYANAEKVGEDTTAPYTFAWMPVAGGSYTLTARAIDNVGAAGTSAGVDITVTDGTNTIVLQQGAAGYVGMTDTQLSSYSPTANFGANALLYSYAQNYGNLFRFAVFAREGGPVPDDASIVSARLEIYNYYYNHIYRLHRLLKPWDEMRATWNLASTGVAWSVPGASGAGSDYASSFDAEFSAPWDPGWMVFDVTNRLRLAAQGEPNYGWRIVPVSGYTGTRRFYSSEYSDRLLRPRLTIRYALP